MHILEQFPFGWDSIPYSTASKPVTYKWDTTKYPQHKDFNNGSGSWIATGPVCAGPYYLDSYDFTTNIATLKKFTHYWNATGLEQLGEFTVETYKVAWIESKDAAIAALKNHEVDVLDFNYQLANDVPTLKSIPGITVVNQAELGWQEMGINMKHPIFGTGVGTPAGKNDPTRATDAARHVRTAISHLIPREKIIQDLLAGAGTPLATMIGPAWGKWYDPSLKPDPYDVKVASSELEAAGYSVPVESPAPIMVRGTPLLGMLNTATGTASFGRELILIQQSRDGGKTWIPIAAGTSTNDGTYAIPMPGPPAFGSTMYRANFTGYGLNETLATKPITVDLANQYINNGATIKGSGLDGRLVPPVLTAPITVSSTTNDTLVTLVPITLIAAVALLARRRKRTS
jgi:ABC-type transport system substrate-binding protein